MYDLIVIGGGPGGYTAAIAAAKAGQSVLVFEGEYIGGTCLNVGCIPTKYLLDKAAALDKVRSLAGEEIFKDVGLWSFQKVQAGRRKVIEKLTAGVEYLLSSNKVTVIKKKAILLGTGRAECDGMIYEAKNIIIATGSVPQKIPVKGAEYAISSTEALELEKIPGRLVVIGGGVIGMELASAFCSFGSEVTVVEALPELFPAEDKVAAGYIQKRLKKRGIRILSGTMVEEIRKAGNELSVFCQGEVEECITADIVLMATGRNANLNGIDAAEINLLLTEKKEIKVNSHMETSLPHVYAIGDAAGGYQLAHAAYAEAEVAVAHILGRESETNLEPMPRCIYTQPCYAACGITEEKAKEQGIETVCGQFSYSANGMALAEGAEGFVRVVMDKKKQTVIGAFIAGDCASEMIALATLAVKKEVTLEEWRQLIVAHPSLSEMVKEAVLSCF